MYKILNEYYYLDLDEVDKYLQLKSDSDEPPYTGETKINIVKYEIVKLMLEVIMGEQDTVDDKLGAAASANLSIPFRVAFNTLLNKKLIKTL